MTQKKRRIYLIQKLLSENTLYKNVGIPENEWEQKQLLRALFNLRMPGEAEDEFLKIQDAYLQEETKKKGITDLAALTPVQDGIYLWKGDITTMRCDAVVNAANCQMLGCFCPNHGCIDNAIHTFSGIQLRAACARLMDQQGHEEETGGAKITPAFNLPGKYVIHTVGPVIQGEPTQKDEELLESCYHSCLVLADKNDVKSIAFCCVSTGEFHFPNDKAAEIAVRTVKKYKGQTNSEIEVIFNVFKETDYEIYQKLLRADGGAGK